MAREGRRRARKPTGAKGVDLATVAAVRPMRPRDAAGVARLSGQLGYPAQSGDIAARFRSVAKDSDAEVFVACGGDEAIRGWLHVAVPRDLVNPPYAEVRALVVDGPYRGRGIGRTLLKAAEEWAGRRGYDSIRVRSNTLRRRARSFYEREGYAVAKTQHQFRKLLDGRA